MTNDGPDLTTSLELLRWIGWAQQQAGLEWVRERGLTHEQSFALGFLVQFPGSIQRDIAAMTRTSAASVSSLLQGLEKRGLIERRADGESARIKRVYATAEGAELISGFDVAMASTEETILGPLSTAERATLHSLLTKVTAVLPRPTRD